MECLFSTESSSHEVLGEFLGREGPKSFHHTIVTHMSSTVEFWPFSHLSVLCQELSNQPCILLSFILGFWFLLFHFCFFFLFLPPFLILIFNFGSLSGFCSHVWNSLTMIKSTDSKLKCLSFFCCKTGVIVIRIIESLWILSDVIHFFRKPLYNTSCRMLFEIPWRSMFLISSVTATHLAVFRGWSSNRKTEICPWVQVPSAGSSVEWPHSGYGFVQLH